MGGGFWVATEVRSGLRSSHTRPIRPIPWPCSRLVCPVRMHTGATMRAAERAGGGRATARVPAIAAAAAAAAAALVGGRRRRWRRVASRRCPLRGHKFRSGPAGCVGGCVLWVREAPGRRPPGRAWPGGHPRLCRRRLRPWACVYVACSVAFCSVCYYRYVLSVCFEVWCVPVASPRKFRPLNIVSRHISNMYAR